MSARPYRLLALVKQDAVVRVQKEPDDTVMTWPHLLSIEFLAGGVMSVFLLLMGLFVNAPLEDLANGNVTPAVAKAPWYFLGLQELLAYFHPTVAGVLVPTFVLVGRGADPVRRPGQPPRDPAVAAQDGGRPVQPVLRPRPDRHVRRDLLPRPRLRLRHPVHQRPTGSTSASERTSRGIRMSNYHVEPADKPQALCQGGHQGPPQGAGPGHLAPPAPAHGPRRRRSASGCSSSPPARSASSGRTIAAGNKSKVLIGTFADVKAQNSSLPIEEGFPAYYSAAKAFVILIDPSRQEFVAGADPTGDGTALNVRALYQRCPHLGCKPNPCLKNFWFECPCHGSRYDRLGIKAARRPVRPGAAEHGPLLDRRSTAAAR